MFTHEPDVDSTFLAGDRAQRTAVLRGVVMDYLSPADSVTMVTGPEYPTGE
jgi:hypothetical protein